MKVIIATGTLAGALAIEQHTRQAQAVDREHYVQVGSLWVKEYPGWKGDLEYLAKLRIGTDDYKSAYENLKTAREQGLSLVDFLAGAGGDGLTGEAESVGGEVGEGDVPAGELTITSDVGDRSDADVGDRSDPREPSLTGEAESVGGEVDGGSAGGEGDVPAGDVTITSDDGDRSDPGLVDLIRHAFNAKMNALKKLIDLARQKEHVYEGIAEEGSLSGDDERSRKRPDAPLLFQCLTSNVDPSNEEQARLELDFQVKKLEHLELVDQASVEDLGKISHYKYSVHEKEQFQKELAKARRVKEYLSQVYTGIRDGRLEMEETSRNSKNLDETDAEFAHWANRELPLREDNIAILEDEKLNGLFADFEAKKAQRAAFGEQSSKNLPLTYENENRALEALAEAEGKVWSRLAQICGDNAENDHHGFHRPDWRDAPGAHEKEAFVKFVGKKGIFSRAREATKAGETRWYIWEESQSLKKDGFVDFDYFGYNGRRPMGLPFYLRHDQGVEDAKRKWKETREKVLGDHMSWGKWKDEQHTEKLLEITGEFGEPIHIPKRDQAKLYQAESEFWRAISKAIGVVSIDGQFRLQPPLQMRHFSHTGLTHEEKAARIYADRLYVSQTYEALQARHTTQKVKDLMVEVAKGHN